MADCSGAHENKSERARLLRASSTDFHNERCEARAGGGISGGVRPHPPAARPLPGEQQLRRVPSRRKQEQGAGVAESCVRNHKLERGRGGEREGMQRKFFFFKRLKVYTARVGVWEKKNQRGSEAGLFLLRAASASSDVVFGTEVSAQQLASCSADPGSDTHTQPM